MQNEAPTPTPRPTPRVDATDLSIRFRKLIPKDAYNELLERAEGLERELAEAREGLDALARAYRRLGGLEVSRDPELVAAEAIMA